MKEINKTDKEKNRSAERELAKTYKLRVFKLEKENYKHIYVFKSMDGWWKVGGHSALFLKYLVGPRIKKKFEIRTDRDFYYSFRDGIIPIKDIDVFEKSLKPLRIFKKGIEPGHIVFDLLGEISPEQIKSIRNIEKEQLNELNKIINPKELLVRTLPQARVIQKAIFEMRRKLDAQTRQLIGRDTTYIALRIMDNILYACRGTLAKDKVKTLILNDIVLLNTRVALLIDGNKIELNNGIKILKHLEFLDRLVVEECGQK